MTEQMIVSQLCEVFKEDLSGCSLALRENQSSEKSVVLLLEPDIYLGTSSVSEVVFLWVKSSGKAPYVKLYSKYSKRFEMESVKFVRESSGTFIRVMPSDFIELISDKAKALKVLRPIFLDSFSSEAFGCCSRYLQCSDARKCVHPSNVFSMGCQYRNNLEAGRIFYGANRNVDTF